jgi:AraC-like DNA-binding protein
VDNRPLFPAQTFWRYFSSDALPERERLMVVNHMAGGNAFPCEVVPTGATGLYTAGHALALPNLFVTYGTSRGVEFRHATHFATTGDVLMLTVTLDGCYRVAQHHEEFLIRPGESSVTISDEAVTGTTASDQTCKNLSLMLPRTAFADTRLQTGILLRQPIRADNVAVRLLLAYVHGLTSMEAPMPPMLEQRAAEHICDLVLLALHAAGDAAQLARERGLPAARLQRLKDDITQRIATGQPIALNETAACHGISPVYVQKLFEREGTNLSAFVLAQRLEYVRRKLLNPRFAALSISRIVFDAGFNNLSWFNRAFRMRYGMTPSDMRATASAISGTPTKDGLFCNT